MSNKKWFICRDKMTICDLNRKVRKGKIKAKNIISIRSLSYGDGNDIVVYWREVIR